MEKRSKDISFLEGKEHKKAVLWRIHSWINSICRTFVGCACQHSSHSQLQLIHFIDADDVNEVSGRVSGAGKEWMESAVEKGGQTGPFDARKKDRGFNRPVVKPSGSN